MIKFEINREKNKIDIEAQGTTEELLSDISNAVSSLICSMVKDSNLEPSSGLVEAFKLCETLNEGILELTANRMSDLYECEDPIKVALDAMKKFEEENNK